MATQVQLNTNIMTVLFQNKKSTKICSGQPEGMNSALSLKVAISQERIMRVSIT
jgi:hypothetical protein